MKSVAQALRDSASVSALLLLLLVPLALSACGNTTDESPTTDPTTTLDDDTTDESPTTDPTTTLDSDTTDADTNVNDAEAQVRQLTFNENGDWIHGFSPDGTRIVFSSDRDGDSEIFVMNLDGTGVDQLTHNDNEDWAASWSPDGTRIAFGSDRDGDHEIFVMNVDGTGVVQLTHNDIDDWGASWSPDSTRIAFIRDLGDDNSEIFIVHADGSNLVRLTDNNHREFGASWSPDGTRIAFDSDRDGDFEIFVMNVDGTGVLQLTYNHAYDVGGSWSPDGTRIAFNSDHEGYSDSESESTWHFPLDVMVMNADGTAIRPLTQRSAYDSGGSWSPDGTRIAFTSDRDGDNEIFIIDADSSGAGGNLDREPSTSEGVEAGGDAEGSAPMSTGDFLGHWPVAGPASCGSWQLYFAPGDSIWIGAEGFAPYSAVEFVGAAASLKPPQGKLLDIPQLSAGQADGTGTVQVMWTIPAAPPADEDSAPRIYSFEGTGVNEDGGTHTVSMLWPVVAYPATAPCAQDDKASTAFGEPVDIAVLDNDIEATANTETHLEDMFSETRGGTFSADTATGIVTFQPDPGFIGTASGLYWSYDSWDVRRRGRIEIGVQIECSIDTPTIGVVLVGTDGDDVICVPDRGSAERYYNFDTPDFDYLVDAKGGDDIVLGGDRNDLIYGGEGADMIYGRGGVDTIIGGPGADIIDVGDRWGEIHGADPDDIIIKPGNDIVDYEFPHILVPGPFTENDLVTVAVSETVTIDVLANDYDIHGDIDPSTLRVQTTLWGGAIVVQDADGNAVISYRAPATVRDEPSIDSTWFPAGSGFDLIVYEICDARGSCADAEVYVAITRP